MEILLLLLLLQIKHCYADFVLQTYMQTIKKGIWLDPIGITHTLEHVYCSMIVLALFLLFFPISAPAIFLVVTVEGLVHYIVDFSKVKYGSKDNTKPIFWTQFGLDQLAHQATYLWMVWYLLILNR
jgi:hypothetical protein